MAATRSTGVPPAMRPMLTAAQSAALARLRFGLEEPGAIVLLVGAAGVGKSLVLETFGDELAAAGIPHARRGAGGDGRGSADDEGHDAILLADDAHAWTADGLAGVAARRTGATVLAGRGRLLSLVARDDRVAARVRLRAVVPPFTLDDSSRLVADRLAPAPLPDPEAVRVMHEIAAAIPGRLVRLLDLVAVVAAAGRRLTAADVEAIHARLGPDAA